MTKPSTTSSRSEAPAFLDQLAGAQATQRPPLTLAVFLELLDDLFQGLLLLHRCRHEHRDGLAVARDEDLLALCHPLQQLGQVGFRFKGAYRRHRPSSQELSG